LLRKSLLAAAAQAKSTGQNVHIDLMQSSRYMHGVRVRIFMARHIFIARNG